jgi:hypothetical protein
MVSEEVTEANEGVDSGRPPTVSRAAPIGLALISPWLPM